MKAISTIITVILLLMITTMLVGLTYIWATDLFNKISEESERAATTSIEQISTDFKIEIAKNISLINSLSNVSVTIRNTGNKNIDLTKISAYVSDVPYTPLGNIGTLPPENFTTFNVSNVPNSASDPICNKVLKIFLATGTSSAISIAC